MCRKVYELVLRLHPEDFRERFATEMLYGFDQASGGFAIALLLVDALISLLRQWLFGAECRNIIFHSSNPYFAQTLDPYKPRWAALLLASLLSFVLLWLVLAGVNRSAPDRMAYLVSVYHPIPRAVPVVPAATVKP
ncbi:hypothetical protein [Bryobacter aggregatus]|uniref:hypothetical protein n=1 Tax=Bryobacter aggregatus TaxID=360054 RepID=UPI0004E22DF2|nr:hypothetical protein [Bryobacter aggregatus]